MNDELRFHVDMRTQEFVDAGMSADDARRAAQEAFGDVAAIDAELRDASGRESGRRAWRTAVHDLGSDARFALRTLRTNWGFATTALLTLSLGIGSTIAVFTGTPLAPLVGVVSSAGVPSPICPRAATELQ